MRPGSESCWFLHNLPYALDPILYSVLDTPQCPTLPEIEFPWEKPGKSPSSRTADYLYLGMTGILL